MYDPLGEQNVFRNSPRPRPQPKPRPTEDETVNPNIIKCWEVQVMADCEGRGMKTLALFYDEEEAKKFTYLAIGRDMYVNPGKVRERELIIFNTVEEAVSHLEKDLRRQALAKLTEAEKKALGL